MLKVLYSSILFIVLELIISVNMLPFLRNQNGSEKEERIIKTLAQRVSSLIRMSSCQLYFCFGNVDIVRYTQVEGCQFLIANSLSCAFHAETVN